MSDQMLHSISLPTSDAQLVGTWVGEYHAESAGLAPVKFCFFQLDQETLSKVPKGSADQLEAGSEVLVGIYQAGTGAIGTIVGRVTGSEFTGVAIQVTPGCEAKFQMNGSITGPIMTWTFKGSDCLGNEDGHGTAHRIL